MYNKLGGANNYLLYPSVCGGRKFIFYFWNSKKIDFAYIKRYKRNEYGSLIK